MIAKKGVSINIPEGLKKDARVQKLINGAIWASIIAGVGGLAWWSFPIIVGILENLLQIVLSGWLITIAGVPLLIVLSILWKTRGLLDEFTSRVSRSLWKTFIASDPLDYIQGVILKFEERIQIFSEARQEILKVKAKLEMKLEEALSAFEKKISIALHHDPKSPDALIEAYSAERHKASATEIQYALNDVELAAKLLAEVEEGLILDVRFMNEDLKHMRLSMEVQQAKSSAAAAYNSIMEGSPNERARLEIANYEYSERIAKHEASFQDFLDKSEPFLKGKRIQDAINTERGRKLLEDFRKNGDKYRGLANVREELEELRRKHKEAHGGDDFERARHARPEVRERNKIGRPGSNNPFLS